MLVFGCECPIGHSRLAREAGKAAAADPAAGVGTDVDEGEGDGEEQRRWEELGFGGAGGESSWWWTPVFAWRESGKCNEHVIVIML